MNTHRIQTVPFRGAVLPGRMITVFLQMRTAQQAFPGAPHIVQS